MRGFNLVAIGRLSVKVGKVGKAAPHAAYIAREAPYQNRLHQGEKLEATETGNLPAWAVHCPNLFWEASDNYERRNGTTYREMEIALPRELTPAQRQTLVRSFVHRELGERHAYQWAIHNPKALDGGEQPHVHLMFSERRCDGIERDPAQYFKRYNAKYPEQGGARKGYGPQAGKTLSRAERMAELKALRERWATLCNHTLAQAGCSERIDMRSHAERGLGIDPERKQLPSAWRQPERRAEISAFRQARAEQAQALAARAARVPDPEALAVQLEDERRRRAEAAARQRQAEKALLALKDAKAVLLAEMPTWVDTKVLDYTNQVIAKNRTAAEQRASIHQDLTQTLIEDVTRKGYPPTSLPIALFEAAADDCLGPMMARCRQARAERARQAEAAEAERQRQTAAAAEEQRIRQEEEAQLKAEQERVAAAEAERQQLLAVNVVELERALARWRGELEQVRRSGPPDAESLATHWAGLPRAKDYRREAQWRVDAVTEEFSQWRQSAASWFGLKRRERLDWEARQQQAKVDLEQAEQMLSDARSRFAELLPEARGEVRRRMEERQRQAAVLQQRIDEGVALIRRAMAVQAQVRMQEPVGNPAQKAPEAPESPQPYKSPYPRPKYPAPGG